MSTSFDHGDTAWMLTSTALVVMMTIPGLAIYYGGMVRVENVLTTAMQSFSIACLITILWMIVGYSLAFAPSGSSTGNCFIGDTSQMWFRQIKLDSFHQLATTIPETVFCAYQLAFAIITAALICGSFADRMKYGPMLLFIGLWHICVYCPLAHSFWHPSGFLFKLGVLDYAGGNVVHISSGIAGLMSTIVVGNRKGFGVDKFDPHNTLVTLMGASFLWVGWFGFNGGSAYKANDRAAYALLATQISTSCSAMSWMLTDWVIRKRPSVLGMVSGAVAGLVAITPAAGYVNMTGAFVIGCAAGPFCFFGSKIKHQLGFDDALDAFGVHATGGILGGLLTGCFADSAIGGVDGAFYGNPNLLLYEICGVCFAIGWSAVVSTILLLIVDYTVGLRVSEENELLGLDSTLHGETIILRTALSAESVHVKRRISEVTDIEQAIISGNALCLRNRVPAIRTGMSESKLPVVNDDSDDKEPSKTY